MAGKLLILMRGPSGIGKSTRARELGGFVLSTDDYFGDNYKDNHTREKLSEAHAWNHDRAKVACQSGASPIVIDNTNIEPWEMKPYVLMAIEHGYEIVFQEADNDLWRRIKQINQQIWAVALELSRRTTHNTPVDRIVKMLSLYKPVTVDDVLNSKPPSSPSKHPSYMGFD